MKLEFKAYHKIKQFKDVVRAVTYAANFKGLDDDGQPIYEESVKPTLTFEGTIKLHGTNAGICYSPTSENIMLAQKRKSFLPKDALTAHFGFNQFVQVDKKEYFLELMDKLWIDHCVQGDQITIYGEWAGGNIQKGVALTQLPKKFYIFDCKVYNPETKYEKWVDISDLEISEEDVYNTHSFETFSVEVDFNNAALSQNKFAEITTEVEKMCPVGKQFGVEGVGEGVVWTCHYKDTKHIFKVKGKKHSTSKVKTLASVDPEVLKNIQEFVEYACTQNRIEQAIKETEAKEKKDMPKLLKWMANDIITEENDVLKANGLEYKQVARECSNRVRQYFFSKIDKI